MLLVVQVALRRRKKKISHGLLPDTSARSAATISQQQIVHSKKAAQTNKAYGSLDQRPKPLRTQMYLNQRPLSCMPSRESRGDRLKGLLISRQASTMHGRAMCMDRCCDGTLVPTL